MKKLGTPIWAAPGSESEKVGFDAEGTPLPDGMADFFFFLCAWGAADFGPGCDDLRCFLVGRDGWGTGALLDPDPEVVVEVEFELEVDLEGDPLCELVWLVVLVVVELDEDVGAQDSVSDCTTPCTGRLSDDTGVPGGTFT